MKKIFYLTFLLFTVVRLSAQAPGGITGSVLWLKANAGASVSTWSDNSGNANVFSQAATLNQPVLAANVFNFNQALQFDGTRTFMTQPSPVGFPTNNNDRTIIVVANATTTSGYRWIFKYGNVGTIGATCEMGNNGNAGQAALANDFYGNDHEFNNYWNAPANLNGALAEFTLSGGNGFQYDRGNFLQFQPVTGLSAPSANAVIGALDGTPLELWSGSIAEVILFNTALSDAQRSQVESYLALKYGFTLGSPSGLINYTASDGTTVYWTASTTYQNDVFGIGTDNGTGLTQTGSNSINSGSGDGTGQSGLGNLLLSTGTALTDKQFLLIGNDAGALTEHTIATGEAPLVAVGSQRLVRNWQVQNTGSAGAVNLSFDVTGLTLTGGSNTNYYRLMIDQDGNGNYNDGTISYIKPTSLIGNKLNFTGITLANNVVFTLITQTSALLPAIWQGFNVTLQKNTATLTWKTSDEINVDHYSVEYSTDGNSFTLAGNIPAKNGAGINTYSFVQDNLPIGIRYFHIKQFDKDGRLQVSDVKSIRVGGVNSVLLKSNPIRIGKLELNIDVQQNQDAIIRIVSTSGKILLQKQTGLSTGTNSISTNISGMAAGSYFLQVQLGSEIINKKFVKL